MMYAATGRYANAVTEFRKALDLDPIAADAYRELARAYEAQNKIQDAEDTYKRAIQLRPGDWLSNGALGTFYYRRSRYRDAETFFRRVIDLTPDNHNGYLTLGGLYIAMGRYQEAESLLKQSISLKPVDQAYSNLGTLYYQLGRYAEAVGMYERAVALDARASYVMVGNLADAYRWAPGLTEKALPAYQKAIELAERQLAINPKDSTVLSRIAAYRAHAGQNQKAVEDIRRARQLAPADATVGFKAVLVYEAVGRRADALAVLKELFGKGYPLRQVDREPELEKLRQDDRYRRLEARYSGRANAK